MHCAHADRVLCSSYHFEAPLSYPNRYKQRRDDEPRINEAISASEIRLIGATGENVGVVSRSEALERARAAGLDLIEVSADARPPVARIMDFGKYRYEQEKKARAAKRNAHATETKSIQVKIATGEHDLALKAKRASEWLTEGHRVKLELYLRGRAQHLDKTFLNDRLSRFLKLITREYKVAEDIKKSPKGLSMVIERA